MANGPFEFGVEERRNPESRSSFRMSELRIGLWWKKHAWYLVRALFYLSSLFPLLPTLKLESSSSSTINATNTLSTSKGYVVQAGVPSCSLVCETSQVLSFLATSSRSVLLSFHNSSKASNGSGRQPVTIHAHSSKPIHRHIVAHQPATHLFHRAARLAHRSPSV